MFQEFVINFTLEPRLTVGQKYQKITNAGSLRQLYLDVSEDPHDTAFSCLTDDRGKKVFACHKKHGVEMLVLGEENYPKALLALERPPLTLYCKGKSIPAAETLLSVIGTRRPSHYGKRIASKIVSELVQAGIGIVSGLARGIDGIAHKAAVDHFGYTLVVLAHGFHQVYPPEHRKLFAQILEAGGTIVSEYPWGVGPMTHHFRDRNRINAALGSGILVVEAGKKSGTKITVHEGLLLNKEIYSIPGPIDSPMSQYPNELIRDGAWMAYDAQMILGHFGKVKEAQEKVNAVFQSPLEKTLVQYLDVDEPRSIETFCVQYAEFMIRDIMVTLSDFECRGIVDRISDGRYVLTSRYM